MHDDLALFSIKHRKVPYGGFSSRGTNLLLLNNATTPRHPVLSAWWIEATLIMQVIDASYYVRGLISYPGGEEIGFLNRPSVVGPARIRSTSIGN